MAHLRHWACLKNAHLRIVNSAFSACDPLPYLHHSDKKFGRTANEGWLTHSGKKLGHAANEGWLTHSDKKLGRGAN